MSRGVENILVENCIFSGTDIGIRFKSALGRGGVVKDITMRNIYMNNIIGEAIIFTMGYVLVNIEDANEGSVTYNADDVPEFKEILMDNIICNDCSVALKINGLKELPIHDIILKNSKIRCKSGLDLKECKNIKLENVTIEDEVCKKNFTSENII